MVCILIHAGLLTAYWLGEWSRLLPHSWTYSFSAMLPLLAVLSGLLPFVRPGKTAAGIMLFRLLAASVLAVPTSSQPTVFGALFCLIIFECYLYLSKWMALGAFLYTALITLVFAELRLSLWSRPADPLDVGGLIVTEALYVLCGAAGYFLSREHRLRERNMKILQQLESSNHYMAETNIKMQNIAAATKNETLTSERLRIAREIHDTMAYTLTNMLSLLDAYREQLQADAKEVPEFVGEARNLLRDGLGDIRRVLRGLRPGEETGTDGLVSIKRLIELFSKATGIKVVLSYGRVPQFPGKELEGVLYRVVQEGLTNAFRHGRATEVLVAFHLEPDGIELTMRDNGQGTDTLTGGYGLIGMQERIGALGGTVKTISQLGFGFTLRVWVPLLKEDAMYGGSSAGDRG